MQAPSLNPKPKTDNSPLSFSKTLEEFGIQFQHSPDYKLIWIPIDQISIFMNRFPHMMGKQGEIEISFTKYTNAILVYLNNLYEKKLIQLPPDISIEYHDGDIVIDF
jgi:hypothetical protein